MTKFLPLAAFAIVTFAGAANATTLDIFLNNGNVVIDNNGVINAVPNINLAADSNLVLSDATLVPSGVSSNGQYAAPLGNAFGGTYLSVFGGNGTVGSATFNNLDSNDFSFTWGTLDSFNGVNLTDASGTAYTVTGAEIENLAGLAANSQFNVNFVDSARDIVTAQLTSSTNSFEASNFASQVPLPGALPLFGAALLGLGALARRYSFNG